MQRLINSSAASTAAATRAERELQQQIAQSHIEQRAAILKQLDERDRVRERARRKDA